MRCICSISEIERLLRYIRNIAIERAGKLALNVCLARTLLARTIALDRVVRRPPLPTISASELHLFSSIFASSQVDLDLRRFACSWSELASLERAIV